MPGGLVRVGRGCVAGGGGGGVCGVVSGLRSVEGMVFFGGGVLTGLFKLIGYGRFCHRSPTLDAHSPCKHPYPERLYL